jgi:hypothetical protein
MEENVGLIKSKKAEVSIRIKIFFFISELFEL